MRWTRKWIWQVYCVKDALSSRENFSFSFRHIILLIHIEGICHVFVRNFKGFYNIVLLTWRKVIVTFVSTLQIHLAWILYSQNIRLLFFFVQNRRLLNLLSWGIYSFLQSMEGFARNCELWLLVACIHLVNITWLSLFSFFESYSPTLIFIEKIYFWLFFGNSWSCSHKVQRPYISICENGTLVRRIHWCRQYARSQGGSPINQ